MKDIYLDIVSEFKKLNKDIQSPDITNNPNKLTQTSKRLAQISPVIDKINTLRNYEENISQAKSIINNRDDNDKDLLEMAEMEVSELNKEIDQLVSEIDDALRKSDPNDSRNAILEIRAGTGGDEAGLFAGDLFRMYTRFAETQNWKIIILNTNYNDSGGIKELVCQINGDDVFGKLKYENGVHRVQRVPETESSGRIHTSAASVVAIPEVDDIDIQIDPQDIKVDVYRASGPGGQSVNTTDSAVRLTHIPTNIIVTCQDEKSQHKNKARAMSILKSKLYELEQERQNEEASDARKSAIKTGDRSVKIRTYNFPDSRVTDHRIKKTWHNLQGILDGDLNEVIEEVRNKLEEI